MKDIAKSETLKNFNILIKLLLFFIKLVLSHTKEKNAKTKQSVKKQAKKKRLLTSSLVAIIGSLPLRHFFERKLSLAAAMMQSWAPSSCYKFRRNTSGTIKDLILI